MAVENDEESSAEGELPEFTKYTGISVDSVTDMLNAVTHKYNDRDFYYIKSDDFEIIRESLGVSRMYIRDNYCLSKFSSYYKKHDNDEYYKNYLVGEMVTFRIREDYCVSNDGWFLISGVWTYLSKDEVLDDYRRCAQGKERLYNTNECLIVIE